MQAPATLNGLPVVKKAVHNNCVTVMCHRDRDRHVPYVVATWWPELGDTWSWGHYCQDSLEAAEMFRDAANRNHRR